MKLAINNGDAYCRYPYAALLYRGAKGFPADRAKGRAYMEVLANPKNKRFKGIPVAMTALAGIYVREDKNYEGARDLYVKAAHAGEPQASVALGRMYLSGELPRDTAMARKYFEIATKSDESSPEAHFLLGSMEMDQEKPNFKGAFQHFQKAASKGLPEAQYNVGLAYFRGVGVPKNDALAIEYWKMSGQQGFGLAQLSLGAYYFQNEEPPKEPEEERAVGSTKTAFRHEWDLSKRDLSQAQKWFTLASRRPGDLGLEGARLKAQVEEAIKKGGGGRRQDRPCTIM
ncbi:hypothetical protein BC939DRAFT_450871 [Gamsiella multidivaricata]|uniref:uncharacterized protein n=1 Tax=Gamsiella multidivaricata TaxID=101098 RepID=UPI00221FC628|nr:uncharacterized protein BC939DRAFT_450871 [Gamsiella multidivaricata]KAI7823806.1 hypothetical protein BC939DRAFT_450871 [Gamsiella multidivaricata]